MTLTHKSVSDLLADFRSSDPTPGGGSAAALAGAIGASLLAMVAGLPKPKTSSEEEAGRLQQAGARCIDLALQLERLVDRDAAAYDLVLGAFKMPKGTDEEKSARTAGIQAALREATEAPLEVMRRCAEALQFVALIAELGNPNASSDVKVGAQMLKAGLAGARENVEINLGSLKDAAYVDRVRQEATDLAGRASS